MAGVFGILLYHHTWYKIMLLAFTTNPTGQTGMATLPSFMNTLICQRALSSRFIAKSFDCFIY